uniref:Uncharacterized protein n=1 Tax=Micrurus corallinus TaxID=54390 RepID=A0A2D4EY41_MICCO
MALFMNCCRQKCSRKKRSGRREKKRKAIILTAVKEIKEEDILNLQSATKVKRVKCTRIVVAKGGIEISLKRNQNFKGKKKERPRVDREEDMGNNRKGEERQKRQGGKKTRKGKI